MQKSFGSLVTIQWCHSNCKDSLQWQPYQLIPWTPGAPGHRVEVDWSLLSESWESSRRLGPRRRAASVIGREPKILRGKRWAQPSSFPAEVWWENPEKLWQSDIRLGLQGWGCKSGRKTWKGILDLSKKGKPGAQWAYRRFKLIQWNPLVGSRHSEWWSVSLKLGSWACSILYSFCTHAP